MSEGEFDIRRLGLVMRSGRERLGLSGREAGARAGFGAAYWLRLEGKEEGGVEIGTLVSIARVLRMEFGELLRLLGLDVGVGISGEMGVLWGEFTVPQRKALVTVARVLLRLGGEEAGLTTAELDAVLPVTPVAGEESAMREAAEEYEAARAASE